MESPLSAPNTDNQNGSGLNNKHPRLKSHQPDKLNTPSGMAAAKYEQMQLAVVEFLSQDGAIIDAK
ncbi:MAG: hypothetical protein ACYCX4_17635, partial [Bacillota bacterium]